MYIIYGGSFNPVTTGHINIVYKLLDDFSDSKVIVLPVGDSFSKDDLISFNHRFNMLKLVFKDNNNVIVSDLENSDKFLGTIKTIETFKKEYGLVSFVIGSDNIDNLDKWIDYETLIKTTNFIIIRRNNDDIDKLMSKYKYLNPKYNIVDINLEGSSTNVRDNLELNRKLIDDKVYKYIKENNLYEE